MTFSAFGDKFTRFSGITRLMGDMNDGLRTPGAVMLGGGNPATDAIYPHHHPKFDIDDSVLPIGVETFARATFKLLAR